MLSCQIFTFSQIREGPHFSPLSSLLLKQFSVRIVAKIFILFFRHKFNVADDSP